MRVPGHSVRIRTVATSVAVLACMAMQAQSRLVLNDGGWVRIDNGAWVVIENPQPNAITTLGSGGNILSEGEFDRVRWQIRNSTGTYVVPFTSASGVRMPLTYTVLGGGSNEPTASVCFSTYNHAAAGIPLGNAWNNDLYRPSDVTHMNSYNAPSVPNSENAVDRFWIIDPGVAGFAYGTRPSIVLDLTYDASAVPGEVTAGNAFASTDPVGAQRFNPVAGLWGDFLPAGAFVPGTPSAVLGVAVPATEFHRSWTLANILDPLPVELMLFDARCQGESVVLEWTTATETNSSHFVIEHSADGTRFSELGRLPAAGTSNSVREYRWQAPVSAGLTYFRLRQVDLDGSEATAWVRAVDCGAGNGTAILNAWDAGSVWHVMVTSEYEAPAELHLLDAAGRLIFQERLMLHRGVTTSTLPKPSLAAGIHVIRLITANAVDSRRVNFLAP